MASTVGDRRAAGRTAEVPEGPTGGPPDEEGAAALGAVLLRHVAPMIEMLGTAIRACPEGAWSPDGGIGVREHVYHAVSSMDLWIHDFSASPYEPPAFHDRNAAMMTAPASASLTRDVVLEFLDVVRAKYETRLHQSDRELLREESLRGRRFSLTDRCLTQLRHTQHHIGWIHRMIREHGGPELPWRSHGEG